MADNATREPDLPAEADRGVVKRPVPQSPFSRTQTMGRERSESFEETLGTQEARAVVVEAVRSRSRLERIAFALPRICRKAGPGRAS